MTTVNKPAGSNTVSPYFIVNDGEKFLGFLKDVLGATENGVYRSDDGQIIHAQLRMGDDGGIMFGVAKPEWPAETGSVFVYVGDTDGIYKKALAQGSESRQAPEDKDYGRAAGFRDPFGNTWWITQV
ncbi:VOC family protein [Chitinophaga caseinilytica]|uniref:VOC family protein n=1 Tax=Chitinophaga caseinilytica TaxID=2267521 RepID=A0ABZ2Z501_9BACT